MTDSRFPSPGVDTRFPGDGTDTRFPTLGSDTRFEAGGDTRFEGAFLLLIDPPLLTYLGSGSFTYRMGTYAAYGDIEPPLVEGMLLRNGVEIGQAAASFTDNTPDAVFSIMEKAYGPGLDARFTPSNSVYVPAIPADTVVDPGEWNAYEALSDANTGKTTVDVMDAPQPGEEFAVYKGTVQFGDSAFLAAMTWNGTFWTWTSTTKGALGTTIWSRVAIRNSTTHAFIRWASEPKSHPVSNVPTAPTFTVATGSGAQEIDATLTNAADGRLRAITSYQYSLDGGVTWATLPGGTALGKHTISGAGFAAVTPRFRAVNANGPGAAFTASPVTPGAAATKPAMFTAAMASAIDSPSANGDQGTLNVLSFPADGGSAATGCFYKINGGSEISFGLTPGSVQITSDTPEADTTVALYLRNAVGDADPYVMTFRPSKTTASTTLASFGADTPANTGGWKPTNALGDEIDILSIASQTGATRAWQVVGGALVASDGTPAADNGKTITVNLVGGGQVAALISTIANARSAANFTELSAAAPKALYAVPASILLRPRDFSDPAVGSNIFKGIDYGATARRTVTIHPGQIKKWSTVNTFFSITDTKYLAIENGDMLSTIADNGGGRFLISGGSSAGTRGIRISNMYFHGLEIDQATLTDPNKWEIGVGYAGAAPRCINFYRAVDTEIYNCLFRNVWSVGDLGTAGALRIDGIEMENVYFDGLRAFSSGEKTPKLIKNVYAFGFFAIYNELAAQTAGNGGSPHNDFIQFMSESSVPDAKLYNALIMNLGCSRRKYYRGDVLAGIQGTGTFGRCVIFNAAILIEGTSGALNSSANDYMVVANSVFMSNGFGAGGAAIVRFGSADATSSQNRSRGEHTFQNVFVRTTSGTAIQVNNSNPSDRAIKRRINCMDAVADTASTVDIFVGPSDPQNKAELFASLTPKVGGPLAPGGAKAGCGAVGMDGNWITEEHPPMHGPKPQVIYAGGNVTIVPQASYMAAVTPTQWVYKYRFANSTDWVESSVQSGGSAMLAVADPTGLQVQTRWIGTNGLLGTWTETQTTIEAGATAMVAATAPTTSRSGTTVTLLAHGTYTANGSPVTPDSYGYTKTINGAQTSWDGLGFTIQPGDAWSISETPVKAGLTGTANPSAEASYQILSMTQAPVIQISGLTVTLVSGPIYDASPDGGTWTKIVAGSSSAWDGVSSIALTAGQTCYVAYLPVKADFYVAGAAQSNTVTASASAYPVVKSNGVGFDGGSTNSSGPYNLTAYAGRAVGDTLFNEVVVDGNPTVTPSAGWTLITSATGAGGSGTQTAYLYKRTADGTSADTLSITLSAAENVVGRKWCFDGAVNIVVSTPHNSSGTQTPNAPNLDLGSSKDALWIVTTAYQGGTGSMSSANVPAGYTWIGNTLSADNSPGVGIAACYRTATAQAENPAAWGQTISNPITYTIGVYI